MSKFNCVISEFENAYDVKKENLINEAYDIIINQNKDMSDVSKESIDYVYDLAEHIIEPNCIYELHDKIQNSYDNKIENDNNVNFIKSLFGEEHIAVKVIQIINEIGY